MFKNTASQKLTVLAFADAGHATLDAGERVTGDAANITLKIEQDWDGTRTASNDVNPSELEDGKYRFDLTQAETNGDVLTFFPESSTAGVQVVVSAGDEIFTRPPNFSTLIINGVSGGVTVQTLNGGTASDEINDIVADEVAPILEDTNELQADWADGGRLDLLLDATSTHDAGAVITAMATGTFLSSIPWNSAWDAEVESECTDALNAYDPPTRTEATADKDAIITEVDANETKIDTLTTTVGTAGAGLTEAGGTGDHLTAILAVLGTPIDTDLATDIATIDTVVDAIKLVTDLLNAAQTEPSGVPVSNETPLTKLAYMFSALLNEVAVTDTEKTFKNNSDVAQWKKPITVVADTSYAESKGQTP